jgi:hypothetical protein
MKKKASVKRNILKAWVTSIIGIAAMVITLVLVYNDKMDFVWDGVAGLTIGTTLLLAPRTIEKQFSNLVGRFSGSSSVTTETTTPTEEPFHGNKNQ